MPGRNQFDNSRNGKKQRPPTTRSSPIEPLASRECVAGLRQIEARNFLNDIRICNRVPFCYELDNRILYVVPESNLPPAPVCRREHARYWPARHAFYGH